MDDALNPFVKTALHEMARLCVCVGAAPLIIRMVQPFPLIPSEAPSGLVAVLLILAAVIALYAFRAFAQMKLALEFHLDHRAQRRALSDEKLQEQKHG